MILYHAIKGVDEHENPDPTSSELVRLIGQNCHSIVANEEVRQRYERHLRALFARPPLLTQAVNFVTEIFYNSSKFVLEGAAAPELPAGVKVPKEDVYVVRAALLSRPTLVTEETGLRNAVNKQHDLLNLTALAPKDAIELAKDL